MTTPATPSPEILALLRNIRSRRAAAPTRDEIQYAVTAALQSGLNVSQVAELIGMPRQQLYQGHYDLTANKLSRI